MFNYTTDTFLLTQFVLSDYFTHCKALYAANRYRTIATKAYAVTTAATSHYYHSCSLFKSASEAVWKRAESINLFCFYQQGSTLAPKGLYSPPVWSKSQTVVNFLNITTKRAPTGLCLIRDCYLSEPKGFAWCAFLIFSSSFVKYVIIF